MFRKRKPSIAYIDDELSGLSWLFSNDEEEPTYGIHHIDKGKLDYSISSLSEINRYLDMVRSEPEISELRNKVVLRAGAYVGEVIRENSARMEFHWIAYGNAMEIAPEEVGGMGPCVGTMAILYCAPTTFCFPLAKVEKYLENGSQEDILFFAKALLTYAG